MLFSATASVDRVGLRETKMKAATIDRNHEQRDAASAQRTRRDVSSAPETFSAAADCRLHPSRGWSTPTRTTVFHFAGAKIMQERTPLFVFFQVFGDMFGKKNVPGVAAIHHPLRHVETGAGQIGPIRSHRSHR